MMLWTENAARFTAHAADVMSDRILSEDGYTLRDRMANNKLKKMGGITGALIVTGDELTTGRASQLLNAVICQSIAHWVPDSSQRLIRRTTRALDIEFWPDWPPHPDCGPDRAQHKLIQIDLVGLELGACVRCARLYHAEDAV